MKYLIYGDPHWSAYSSIIRSRGNKYSTRLENLIDSINWVEEEAVNHECDAVICLGDFFDQCDIKSEEITALQDINWNDKKHYFIIGNHEMGRSNLEFSSTHLFNLCPNTIIIEETLTIKDDNSNIVFIPYTLESNRKELKEYLNNIDTNLKTIIMSHNDIKDIQMGKFISKEGFSINEILNNCALFINGHLHNHNVIENKIINLGNLTGQNFSEDATKYKHMCMVLDTKDNKIEYLENPIAFKFYKFDFTREDNIFKIKSILNSLLINSIVTVKINSNIEPEVRECIKGNKNIIESRILIEMNSTIGENKVELETLSIDHINKFIEYVKNEIGNSELILEELNHIAGD